MDRSRALLWDVQTAIVDVSDFLSGHDEETYLKSPILRAAVERKLHNVLVHGYAVVEHATVYSIARQRLPELENVIRKLLE